MQNYVKICGMLWWDGREEKIKCKKICKESTYMPHNAFITAMRAEDAVVYQKCLSPKPPPVSLREVVGVDGVGGACSMGEGRGCGDLSPWGAGSCAGVLFSFRWRPQQVCPGNHQNPSHRRHKNQTV